MDNERVFPQNVVAMQQPFHRTVRQFTDGSYFEGGRSRYISHPDFADNPSHYVRSYLILQEDYRSLFEYVEPDDRNLQAFSLRMYALLLRVCTEVETNFKAIFRSNTYSKSGNLTIEDYYKINASHYLSQYEVWIPYWTGTATRKPFAAWASERGQLSWYNAYNQTKHDRATNLHLATLEHLTDAMCALVVLLSAQFLFYDFGPGDDVLLLGGPDDGRETAIGEFFRVRYPDDVPMAERYSFNWQELSKQPAPFAKFDYDALS